MENMSKEVKKDNKKMKKFILVACIVFILYAIALTILSRMTFEGAMPIRDIVFSCMCSTLFIGVLVYGVSDIIKIVQKKIKKKKGDVILDLFLLIISTLCISISAIQMYKAGMDLKNGAEEIVIYNPKVRTSTGYRRGVKYILEGDNGVKISISTKKSYNDLNKKIKGLKNITIKNNVEYESGIKNITIKYYKYSNVYYKLIK